VVSVRSWKNSFRTLPRYRDGCHRTNSLSHGGAHIDERQPHRDSSAYFPPSISALPRASAASVPLRRAVQERLLAA